MITPERYLYDGLVGWMEKNAPEVLAVIRLNDMQATSAALLGWMAENRRNDLWLIHDVEAESIDGDTPQWDLDCAHGVIDAIEDLLGSPYPDFSNYQLPEPVMQKLRKTS